MRHLGRVRQHFLTDTAAASSMMSKALLTEMAMRVIKNTVNKEMRQRMLELSIPRDCPFHNIIISFFNLICMAGLLLHFLALLLTDPFNHIRWYSGSVGFGSILEDRQSRYVQQIWDLQFPPYRIAAELQSEIRYGSAYTLNVCLFFFLNISGVCS